MMNKKWFKLKTGDITVVQFIIEGYEGLATVSTINPKEGIIQVLIMSDFIHDMAPLLEELRIRFAWEEMIPSEEPVCLC